MRVVPLVGLEKDINRYRFFIFFISVLNIWKVFKVLSRFKQKWIKPASCSGLYRILSSHWLAHFFYEKNRQRIKLFWIAGCWNSSLTSRNPKNNCCLSRIFWERFGGKNRGLCTYKPVIRTSRRIRGIFVFSNSKLWILFKIKNQ